MKDNLKSHGIPVWEIWFLKFRLWGLKEKSYENRSAFAFKDNVLIIFYFHIQKIRILSLGL